MNFKPCLRKKYFAAFLGIIIALLSSNNAKANNTISSFTVNKIGQGEPVILIPGLMSDGRVWSKLSAKLAGNYQLHIINIAGFAATAKIKEQSLVRVKNDLFLYIDQQQLHKPTIIGHSLGGFLAFWLASSKPNIIGPIVSIDGLPFIGPVFSQNNESTVADFAQKALGIRAYYSQMTAEALAQQTKIQISRQATSVNSQQLLIEMSLTSDPKTVGNAIYTLLSQDLRSSIGVIKQPVLLIGASGAFDNEPAKQYVQKLYKQQLSNLPHAQLIMNKNSRHFIMLDQPQWLNEQLELFLGEVL